MPISSQPVARRGTLGALFLLVTVGLSGSPGAIRADPLAGTWNQLPPPYRRYHHTAIHDPVRHRLVIFAGSDGTARFNDVWVVNSTGTPRWTRLVPSGPLPAPRFGHAAIYDPVRDRMLVWGGRAGTAVVFDDLWELTLGATPAWSQLGQLAIPPARWAHSLIYDPDNDRLVMFGGALTTDTSTGYDAEVWELPLSGSPSWSQLAPGAGPVARRDHVAAYDPVGNRMIVFGGNGGTNLGDLWAMNLIGTSTWGALTAAGTPPAPRADATIVYDAAGDRLLLFGGNNTASPPFFNDLWELSLSGSPEWMQLLPTGTAPAGRFGHAAVIEPATGAMLVHGGGIATRDDLWSLTLDPSPSWSELHPVGFYPGTRQRHEATYDPVRRRMILVTGQSAGIDVQSLALDGDPLWAPVATAGTHPPARELASAVYDPPRDRILLLGGLGVSMDHVWALPLTGFPAWSQIFTSGPTPPGMEDTPVVYDPVRDRMVLHYCCASPPDDVWTLDLAGVPTWARLLPTGPAPPAPRLDQTMIYDPPRDRMIVFGGSGRSDVWELLFTPSPAWTEIVPSTPFASGRQAHTAIHDPVRDRMVVFGGGPSIFTNSAVNEVWELTLSGSADWSQLVPAGDAPRPRALHAAIYDPIRDRMIAHGGQAGGAQYSDVWELRWTENVGVPPPMPVATGLALYRAHAAGPGGTLQVSYSLATSEPARLLVVDVTGRRVAALDLAGQGPGRASVTLDGTAALPSGVYFLRLTQGTEAAAIRAALIR